MIWQSPTRQTLCSRCVSVKWQTVSKAADRSRPISTKSAVRRKPVRKLRYVGRHRGRRGCLTGPSSTSSFHHHVCVVLLSSESSACLPVRTFQGSVMSDSFFTSSGVRLGYILHPSFAVQLTKSWSERLRWRAFTSTLIWIFAPAFSRTPAHTHIHFFPNCFINLLIPPPCLRGPFVIPHMS